MKKRYTAFLLLVGVAALAGRAWAQPVDESIWTPTFNTDEVISSDKVNKNFKALKDATNSKQDPVQSCAAGQAIRAVSATGTVTCEVVSVPNGGITGVNAGAGLSGGGSTGTVTLSVDNTATQKRVTGTCNASQKMVGVNADGTVNCQADADSGGDITGVTAGSGLTGGGATGAVTLSVDTAVTQARVTGTCGAAQKMLGVNANGTVNCAADAGANIQNSGVEVVTSAANIQLTNTTSSVLKLSLTVPAAGKIVVSFSAYYRMNHVSGTADTIELGVSDSGSSSPSSLNSRRFLYLDTAFPSGNFFGSVAGGDVFVVTAGGTYTYYLLGLSDKAASTVNFYVSHPMLQALFIPN